MGQDRAHLPTLAQVMRKLGTQATLSVVPPGPVGGGARGHVVVCLGAVRIGHGLRAPHRASGVALSLQPAQRQGHVTGEIHIQRAVQRGEAFAMAIEVAVAVLCGPHQPPPHAAIGVQRARNIPGQPPGLPRADAGRAGCLERGGGPLAHEVEGRRRLSGAGQQAVRAPQDLDAVIDQRIDIAPLGSIGERQADAIQLEVVDVEAPCRVVGAVGLDALDRHARCVHQRVVHGIQAKVVELGPREGADGLRRFLRREGQSGGRARAPAAVAVAVLRGGVLPAGRHRHPLYGRRRVGRSGHGKRPG